MLSKTEVLFLVAIGILFLALLGGRGYELCTIRNLLKGRES